MIFKPGYTEIDRGPLNHFPTGYVKHKNERNVPYTVTTKHKVAKNHQFSTVNFIFSNFYVMMII